MSSEELEDSAAAGLCPSAPLPARRGQAAISRMTEELTRALGGGGSHKTGAGSDDRYTPSGRV